MIAHVKVSIINPLKVPQGVRSYKNVRLKKYSAGGKIFQENSFLNCSKIHLT